MSGLNSSGEFGDVLDDSWIQAVVTVGATQVEAKVGASRSTTREMIIIHNKSNATVYYGPSGVTITTGIPLLQNQFLELMVGSNQAVYLIAAAANKDVIVAEIG
jgi:hypothetical protein